MEEWKLKRTAQCQKCPWIKGSNPHEIPNGYCEIKHRNLVSTIVNPSVEEQLRGGKQQPAMACHETHDAHCLGWLMNQLGPGNNIMLRMAVRTCTNIGKVRLRGEQHETFKDTLPK